MDTRGDLARPASGSRILRRRQLPPGLAVAAALLLSACHLTGSFRTGPEGQSMHDTELRRLARDEQFSEALELTEIEQTDEIGDELLRLMQRGLLLHYAGEYEKSNALLQEAERIIDDRYTKSVSLAVLSLVTNDRALAWLPSGTERLMVNYYGALNYLALGDPEEAAVEARRMSRLLQLSEEDGFEPGQLAMRRVLRYFAGAVFEASGDDNDAAVAYRHVWSPADDVSTSPLRPRFLDLWGEDPADPADAAVEAPKRDIDFVMDSVRAANAARTAARGHTAGDSEIVEDEPPETPDMPEPPPVVAESRPAPVEEAELIGREEATPGGDVIVLLELGLVAHRIERSLNIPIFPEEAGELESSNADVRFATAACVASRSFHNLYDFTGVLLETGTDWRGNENERCVVRRAKRSDEEEDEESGSDRQLYLMRVAWPEMVASGLPTDLRVDGLAVTADVAPLRLAALDPALDSEPVPALIARPAMTGSVSEAVTEEFGDKLGGILIKSVARAALKYELARGLEKELGEEDEILGDIAFYAANATGALLERADTRSWHLLPDRLQVVRLRLPPGEHPLAMEVETEDGARWSVDLGTVRVRDGGVQVLSARVWP